MNWKLKRNCSIAPRQLILVFVALNVVSFTIAIGFALFGPWVIVPFAGVEMLVLGIAFWVWSQHATDYERVAIENGKITLQVVERERVVQSYEWNPHWARLEMVAEPFGCKLLLSQAGKKTEIARHLDGARKLQWMVEFKSALAACRVASQGGSQNDVSRDSLAKISR
jgi:uncharacterized membrane protein